MKYCRSHDSQCGPTMPTDTNVSAIAPRIKQLGYPTLEAPLIQGCASNLSQAAVPRSYSPEILRGAGTGTSLRAASKRTSHPASGRTGGEERAFHQGARVRRTPLVPSSPELGEHPHGDSPGL